MIEQTEEARFEYQKALGDLADKYLDAELAKGTPFSEGLCSWAIDRAMEDMG